MIPPSVLLENPTHPASPNAPSAGAGTVARTPWSASCAWRRGLVVCSLLAVGVLLFLGVSRQLLGQPFSDVTRYQCDALIFWQGSQGVSQLPASQCAFLFPTGHAPVSIPAFQVLPAEYPPLTLLLFSLPLLAPLSWYPVVFALLMACMALLTFWLLHRYGPPGSGWAYVIYLLLGAVGTAEARFDVVPACLTVCCLLVAQRRHWTLAYLALAVAFLLKLYPVLLLPALFLAEQIDTHRIPPLTAVWTDRTKPWQVLCSVRQWRWKNLLLWASVSVGISVSFALLNVQGALASQLTYAAARPVQVEATGSTLLWLATLVGHPATVVYSFGSHNVVSDVGPLVERLGEICLVLGSVLVLVQQWRGKLDLAHAFLGLLLVLVVTSKVFSPQYLLWLIPVVASTGGLSRLWRALFGGSALLTSLIYPFYYMYIPQVPLFSLPGFLEVVALRNLLLVVATLAVLWCWPRRGPQPMRLARHVQI